MKLVTALQFKLGCATPDIINVECRKFFEWLAKTVIGEPCSLDPNSPKYFVPLSNHLINDASQSAIVYTTFWDIFKLTLNSSSIFLIDFIITPGVLRAHLSIHLARAVNEAIDEIQTDDKANKDIIFVIILPEIPPITDGLFIKLAKHIKEKRIVIFSHSGEYSPDTLQLTSYSPEEFSLMFATSRGDSRKLIEKKMICRIGHFKRKQKDDSTICTKHFYDGQFCQSEIVKLLETTIREKYGIDPQIQIIYHRGLSTWLKDPVLTICNWMSVPCTEIDLDIDTPPLLQYEKSTLLIVGLVNTGGTLSRIVDKIDGQIQSLDKLEIVTILSTHPTAHEEHVREWNYKNRAFRITYFMCAKQQIYYKGNCPLCKADIPKSDANSENYRMLTSDSHWEMSIQAGLKKEQNTPAHRSPLPYVIDYPKMINIYGAWLASKVRDILGLLPGGFPADATIVCPEGETGSAVFSEYLQMLFSGVTVIRVPRNMIDAFAIVNHLKSDMQIIDQEEKSQWYHSLVSTARLDVIIMDEFNAKGTTLESLRNLVNHFGKSVLCFFVLNDLNPTWSEQQNIPVYALYRWQSYQDYSTGYAL